MQCLLCGRIAWFFFFFFCFPPFPSPNSQFPKQPARSQANKKVKKKKEKNEGFHVSGSLSVRTLSRIYLHCIHTIFLSDFSACALQQRVSGVCKSMELSLAYKERGGGGVRGGERPRSWETFSASATRGKQTEGSKWYITADVWCGEWRQTFALQGSQAVPEPHLSFTWEITYWRDKMLGSAVC